MKNRIVRILRIVMPLVSVICMVVFVPWAGVWAWLAPLPDTVQKEVDAASGRGLDGIVVYVDRAGKAPEFYASGWKDRANHVKADPRALFKIASISKLYIATATAKLVEAKKLSLDATLAKLLPSLADKIANADRITLKMMVQHRSGIPNFTDQPRFDWSKRQEDPNENLKLILDKPADFEPDASYHYSNSNYLLIGRILDNTLGYSHQKYIEEEIVAPLGLTHTYSQLQQVNQADLASGYHYKIPDDLKGLEYTTPGGSMVATADDVGTFLRALNDGSLLSKEEQAVYTTIYPYDHTGWVPGYQSIARYHKDMDTVVIQFVSSTGGSSELVAKVVYNRIVKILHQQEGVML